MGDLEQLCSEKISNGTRNGSGCESDFIILDDNIGAKLIYAWKSNPDHAKHIRNLTMERQRQAAELGIAPEVHGTIDLPKLNRYGYVTERANVLYHGGNKCFKGDVKAEAAAVAAVDKEMYDKLGWWYVDNHVGNYGFLPNGKLVRIDFGQGCLTDMPFQVQYYDP